MVVVKVVAIVVLGSDEKRKEDDHLFCVACKGKGTWLVWSNA